MDEFLLIQNIFSGSVLPAKQDKTKEKKLFQKSSIFPMNSLSIVCRCNQIIKLTQYRGKYQLSNFYRHHKVLNRCSVMTSMYNKNNLSSAILLLNPVSDTSFMVPSTSTQSKAQALSATTENINFTSLSTYTRQTNDTAASSAADTGSKRLITSSQIDETSSAKKRFFS